MSVRPDEVTEVMRRELERYRTEIDTATVGAVIEVGDGIARVYGLDRVMASELVEFPGDVLGIALDLQEDNVGCLLMGPDQR
ncbi:MAG: F0F1 ATP synthase subunit alpha, partial [Armatimonadota bacterium]